LPRQKLLNSTTRRSRDRELKLTPEGWGYLTILAFISVGAVLRNVNLLIFMAGMMYAPVLLNWRIGVGRLQALSATRFIPTRIHANDSTMIQWTCSNRHKGLPAWNVIVNDSVKPARPGTSVSKSQDTATDIESDLTQSAEPENWIGLEDGGTAGALVGLAKSKPGYFRNPGMIVGSMPN